MPKDKQTTKPIFSKSVVVSTLVILAVGIILFSVYVLFANRLATQNVSQTLRENISQKSIMMEDYLQPEIALTKKLATSPTVIDFFKNPSDEEARKHAMAEFKSFQDSFSAKMIFWTNDIDKEFWNDMQYSYTINPSNPADYWYNMTLYETEVYNFNINYNAEIDKTCLWLNAVVRNEDKTPIGMAGTGIELDSFIEKSYTDLEREYSMFFFNEKKEITGAKNKKLLAEKMQIETIYGAGIDFDALMKEAKKHATNTESPLYNFSVGSSTLGVICYLPSYGWYLISTAPRSAGHTGNTMILLIVLIFVQLIISTFVIIISKLSTVMAQIRASQKKEREMGEKLYEEAQNLVVSTKETAATSQDSSAAVKEIVATMEDSNVLSENISSKIKDVSSVANKTSADVKLGVAKIEQNVQQLHEIFSANKQTIEGIKTLSEKIESIWDIVTLINNVADQAKIIAFNAELEASTAGEAGKSFRIVANEIRRLSDGIIDGTREIKEKINEIQHSSDTLILASESSTEKINTGYENARGLGESFESIKNSAEITAASALDITEIIQQQTTASEQILVALKEISGGVENFTVATDNISNAAENVRKISEDLNNASNGN